MSSTAETATSPTLRVFLRCLREQRLAHAYLVSGPSAAAMETFIRQSVQALFCDAADAPCGHCGGCRRVHAGIHPDVHRVEPRSKARQIVIEQVRDLMTGLGATAYEGGWKAAVIAHADRMNTSAANALLKTLEEPPGRCVLFLATQSPSSLPYTIVSRCQRLAVGAHETEPASPTEEPPAWLERGPPLDPLERMRCVAAIEQALDAERTRLRKEMEDSRRDDGDTSNATQDDKQMAARIEGAAREIRSALLRNLLHWQRDLLFTVLGLDAALLHYPSAADRLREQAARIDPATALARVRAVERMAARMEKNLPSREVFDDGWRTLARQAGPDEGPTARAR